MTALAAPAVAAPQRVRRHEWLYVLRGAVRSRRGAVGLVLTLLVVGVAVIGPFVAPHGSTDFVTGPFAHPGHGATLGGDNLGRDVLSRVLEGGWKLLYMAIAATALGIVLGAMAGVSAAYMRGWRDNIIMRTVDIFLAFPQIVFALLLVSIIGPKTWLLIVAVGLSHAPQVARVLRATALEVSERDFVKAVEITGVRRTRIMRTEIVPNLITPLMVESGLRLTYSIIIIAGLSFIGFGIQPPGANWGLMINENRIGLTQNPWAVVVPALLIAVLTVGVNTLTDAIARVALGVERAEVVMATEAVTSTDVTG